MIKQNIQFIVLLTFSLNVLVAQESINQFDENGNRHGKWSKNFEGTNQLRYKGQFEHGKETGLFHYYQMVGKKSLLAATKDFDPESGLAKTTFLSLKGLPISTGIMKGKLYVGEWIYYHKNSEQPMTVEQYNEEGKLNGDKKVYYENGQLAEHTIYEDGKLNGDALYYSEDGVLIKQYIYVDDQLHGLSKHYNGAGRLILEGNYKNGKKHGIWRYYRNGELYEEKDFSRVVKSKTKN